MSTENAFSRSGGRAALGGALLVLALAAPARRAPGQAAPSPAAPAATPVPQPSAAVSEDLVVSATRVERSASDLPVSTTIVRREALVTSPARSADEALRQVVGVQLPLSRSTYLFPNEDNVSIRGVGIKRSLVLFDDVPLNDPFSGAIQWNKVPFDEIGRVEVIRGASGGLFGNQAIGGLVDLVPRPIVGDAADAEVSYGSYGTARASGYARTMLTPSFGIAASAQWLQTDGFVKAADGDRGLVDTPSSARNALGALDAEWTGDSGSRARVRAGTFRESFSLGTPVSREDRTISDVSAEGEVPTGAAAALRLSGFFQHQQLSFDNAAFIGSGRNDEFRANRHDDPIQALGGSALWTHASASALSLLVVGADVQQNRGEDRAVSYSPAGAPTQRAVAGGDQLFGGAFLEATVDLSARWQMLANARLDLWRNSGGRLETDPGDATAFPSESKTHFDPRLALRYEASPALALRAAGYRGFRAPYLRELYYGTLAKTMLSQPNPGLGPESAAGGEFGADLSLGGVRLEATAFRSVITEMIGTVQTQSAPIRVTKVFNVGTGRSQGVETALGWAPAPAFRLQAAYAYTDARVTSSDLDPSIPGSHIPYVPRHLVTGSIAVRIPLAGTLVADGRSQSVTYLDAANRLRLDPSTVFDAALTREIGAGLEARIAATNIFDRRYVSDVTVGRQIGDPCEFTVALRWSSPVAASSTAPTH